MLRSIPSLLLAPAFLLVTSAALGQRGDDRDAEATEAIDRTPQECVQVSRIDRTEVIDDRTVIFHMDGRGVAYRNYLPRRCPGLERNERFMYQVTSNRLCRVDTITVLEQFGGGLNRGFTCGLGEFHPITDEEIEELRLIEEGRGDAIEAERADLPDDEADEADDGAESSEPDAN